MQSWSRDIFIYIYICIIVFLLTRIEGPFDFMIAAAGGHSRSLDPEVRRAAAELQAGGHEGRRAGCTERLGSMRKG